MSEKTDLWWMTIDKCRQYCRRNYYTYFGLAVLVVAVLYSPNRNIYRVAQKSKLLYCVNSLLFLSIADTCKTNNSIKHIWQVAREALVLSQLAAYS